MRDWWNRVMNTTFNCLFGKHEVCGRHIECACVHHSEHILEVMST